MSRHRYRRVCTLLAASLLCFAVASATPSHPDNSTATLTGSFKASLPLPLAVESDSSSGDGGTEVHIWVWRTVGGRVDYVIDADSLVFSGDRSSLDTTTAAAFFDALSRRIVLQGIAHSFSTCDSTESSRYAQVYHGSCVTRTGLGASSAFSLCSTDAAHRIYQHGCGTTAPALLLTGSYTPGGSCTGTCEPAYSTDAPELALVSTPYSRADHRR